MHPGVARDGDAPAGHPSADPLDPADVPADLQLLAPRSLDFEEIVQAMLPFPQDHRQGAYLVVPERGDDVRGEDFGLQRHVGTFLQREDRPGGPFNYWHGRTSGCSIRSISTG